MWLQVAQHCILSLLTQPNPMLQMLKLQNKAPQKFTKHNHKIHHTDCTFFLIEIWDEDYNIFI